MGFMRGVISVLILLAVGALGYGIGLSQAAPAALPPVVATAPSWYGPQAFVHGIADLFVTLVVFFLFFGMLSAALWGGRHGWGHSDRRRRFEELHRELHGEKPGGGTTAGA